MHKIIIFVLLSTITLLISSCDENSPITENTRTVKETALIKKTMQIQSYDEEGNEVFDNSIKDDGYYQKGLEPTYTRASEIVRDDLTTLMWQDNIEVTTILKSYLNDKNFALCDVNKSSQYCSDTSGDTATTYCSELSLGGYTDWRLPRIYELSAIVNITKNPTINETFVNTTTDQHISSNAYISGFNYIWGTHFYFGTTTSYANNHKIRVRCVRDDNTQTVDINNIEFEWQDNEIIPTLKWEEAINYCEELNLNGMGWRLPNINELKSIVDYSKNNPAIKSSFSEITPLYYWSSSTSHTIKSSAWSIYFKNGDASIGAKIQKNHVRCVR